MTEEIKNAMRLVVTGHDAAGKSRFVSAAPVQFINAQHTPGFKTITAWATSAGFAVPDANEAFRRGVDTQHPDPGESRLLIVTFPPDSIYATPNFDHAAAATEMGHIAKGIAERFEPEHPGMHRTDSLDYALVLSGEMVLELDDGATQQLKLGDIVVQNGTRHAWRNASDKPATMVFVMLGGARTTT